MSLGATTTVRDLDDLVEQADALREAAQESDTVDSFDVERVFEAQARAAKNDN